MPGKHNAGGCGCCGSTVSCFDGDCVGRGAESAILSGSDLNNGCSPDDIDGTYVLVLSPCGDSFVEVRTSCSGHYTEVTIQVTVSLQKIVGPTPYRIVVETSVYWNNPGTFFDDWRETDEYHYTTASCPTVGTVSVPHHSNTFSGGGGVGPDPGYTRPSVQVVII